MSEKRSIDIILVADHTKIEGTQVGVITHEVLTQLNKIVNENEKSNRESEKLRVKNEQALRAANKLMKRIITTHGITFNYETEALGVSKTDVLYIGPKDRVKEAPDAEPQEGDVVVGTLMKYERRKYDELLSQYEYLKDRIQKHNQNILNNEDKLLTFENQILTNIEYDQEANFLAVYPNGKVFLGVK